MWWGGGGDLNEIELRYLPEKEFKVMVIKMLIKLGRRMDEHNEKFNKEIENIIKYHRSHRAEEYNY